MVVKMEIRSKKKILYSILIEYLQFVWALKIFSAQFIQRTINKTNVEGDRETGGAVQLHVCLQNMQGSSGKG